MLRFFVFLGASLSHIFISFSVLIFISPLSLSESEVTSWRDLRMERCRRDIKNLNEKQRKDRKRAAATAQMVDEAPNPKAKASSASARR